MDQRLLDQIADTLNDSALNYTVFLKLFEMPLDGPLEKHLIIKALLGPKATLDDIKEIDKALVWPILNDLLFFRGNEASGPDALVLKSQHLVALVNELKSQVSDLIDAAQTIDLFQLQDGHPAYPVFWDFAFLFLSASNASILIGSSSD
ncbi:hypothetical protein GOZ78_00545 [Agrobacterium vitis]|uniref:Uncharacterized protein n=1 Tax=Agrobacterium vitis TaxID=373 RepID=A0ABD6GEX7_AGRVI|nr:hypothetical protein [Agrobacterium vitis]MUO77386.1 hypothetical protein [Agrobacterium vitis]MUO92903.1 hypothetical protein [Agrobacterium vitis]MUP07517.1 hypothetical protein [Agrobacterium vitis]MUZ81306.1 hypothetical protein [Agrobacterium vitis]MVA08508.1 hypothetical protein [Agrobacterium vitis]